MAALWLLLLSGCGGTASPVASDGNALFSWDSSVTQASEREALFDTMDRLGLTVLYQHFSPDLTDSEVRGFLRAAAEKGIQVYLLTGSPEWCLDPGGAQMRAEAARAARYNFTLTAEEKLRGILMDAEPYLTREWEEDREGTMKSYVDAMCAARKAAARQGLRLTACIPFYLDNMEQSEELARLIQSGCDALAIMNYSYTENQIIPNLAESPDFIRIFPQRFGITF